MTSTTLHKAILVSDGHLQRAHDRHDDSQTLAVSERVERTLAALAESHFGPLSRGLVGEREPLPDEANRSVRLNARLLPALHGLQPRDAPRDSLRPQPAKEAPADPHDPAAGPLHRSVSSAPQKLARAPLQDLGVALPGQHRQARRLRNLIELHVLSRVYWSELLIGWGQTIHN